jgi:hypothetical protein
MYFLNTFFIYFFRVKNVWEENYKNEDTKLRSLTSTSELVGGALSKRLKAKMTSDLSTFVRDEFEEYLNAPVCTPDTDPLLWWRSMDSSYPTLSRYYFVTLTNFLFLDLHGMFFRSHVQVFHPNVYSVPLAI